MGRKRKAKAEAEPTPEAKAEPTPEAAPDQPKALVEKPAPEEAEYPENGYEVAKGRSISTGGNIIGEGEPIEPSDIHEDEKVAAKNFDAMLNSGLIVEA